MDRHDGQGNFASAILRALQETLAIDQATYGPAHEQVATDLNKLGLILHGVGRLNEAKTHFERAMSIHEGLYGPYHPQVATDLHYVGVVLSALGDLRAAKSHYERALAIDEAAYGRSHPRVTTDLEHLQTVQREMGETPIGDIFADSVTDGTTSPDGPEHPTIEWVLNSFGLTVSDLEGELTGLDYEHLQKLQSRSPLWSGKPAGRQKPPAPDEIFYWSNQTPSQAMESILASLPPAEEHSEIWTSPIGEGLDLFAPEAPDDQGDWLPHAEPDSPDLPASAPTALSGAELGHADSAHPLERDWSHPPPASPAWEAPGEAERHGGAQPDWTRTPEPDWLGTGDPDWATSADSDWLSTPEPDWAAPPGATPVSELQALAPITDVPEESLGDLGQTYPDDLNDVFFGSVTSVAKDPDALPVDEELPRLPAPLEGALDRPEKSAGATDLYNQACLLRDLGDLAGARDMFQQALDADEAALGPHHPAVANNLSGLGTVLRDLGDLAGAKAALERAVTINEEAPGEDNAGMSTDLSDLGGVLRDLGDLEGARVALERAVAIDQTLLGRDHPTLSTDLNTLAGVLSALGELSGARAALEQALAIDETAYGKDHPKVATRLNNLGNVLRSQGDLFGARACLERALSIAETSLGEDHPKVATRLGNLGNVLKDLGDPFAARPHLERALAIDEATYGQDHPRVASRLTALADVLQAIGNVRAARSHIERAIAITEAVYGRDHPKFEARMSQLNRLLAQRPRNEKGGSDTRRNHSGGPGGIIRISSLIG